MSPLTQILDNGKTGGVLKEDLHLLDSWEDKSRPISGKGPNGHVH